MEKLAARLKKAMELRCISQSELSRLTGIGKSSISTYLTGLYEPKQRNIVKLAFALGVSERWLLEGNAPMGRMPAGFEGISGIEPVPVMKKVPRLGTIACGTPILAEENFDGYDNVPEPIHCDFTLRCKGDSMINARITDGDIVYVRCQPEVENGEIAAVLIDGEATLKRVYMYDGQIILQAENPAYAPLVYTGASLENVRIIGKAVAFSSTI